MFDVVNARYINDYKIEFHFSDKSSGVVDFTEYKSKPGLFQSFKDIDFFKNFTLDKDLSTIKWENGLDIAPDTLYIKATGKFPGGLI